MGNLLNLEESILDNKDPNAWMENYLIDMREYLERHPIEPIPTDHVAFSKDNLAKRSGMEWLNGVECNLLYPMYNGVTEQIQQLRDFAAELKEKANRIPYEFAPEIFTDHTNKYLVDYNEPVLALDTETTGLDTRIVYGYDGKLIKKVSLVGTCIAYSDSVGYYLPVMNTEEDGIPNWNSRAMIEFLDQIHDEFTLVYHNAPYDREVVTINGAQKIRPFPYFFDTQLIFFLSDCNQATSGLKLLSEKILGRKMIELVELFQEAGMKFKSKADTVITFDRISATTATVYACSDPLSTLGLLQHYAAQGDPENVFRNQPIPLTIDHKMVDTLRDLYRNGLPINYWYCYHAVKDVIYRVKLLTENIYKQAGKEFNISSPAQVSRILFDENNIPVLPGMKRGAPSKKDPNGLYSTAAEILEELNAKYPQYEILHSIVKFRQLENIMIKMFLPMMANSFVDAFIPYTRVRLSYQQTVVPTGRLSSSSNSGRERVIVGTTDKGSISLKYKRGAWDCGFNSQGVNNDPFRTAKARHILTIPELAGINIENPYPNFVMDEMVKNIAGI